ncbi:MAG: tRNA uridine-5-carboxymethylaminomethyl(34) synthesis enzyme MnmG [Candidatus Acetothermia bacterium]|jgi:tRNA uridine 5-carboxymethylaminomethyl modification enzyme|nr:tRNA uridine-5-carboxymethylaminomethyl(34) synthesis enzyme MnmG [Candidatus Acetothermia bacterium]MDH7504983.1 tRNA uridine-5-carboxymethylaminomethyl(34) synthesis enzyme MnmG [Candidatus Acetothermia bacterium]
MLTEESDILVIGAGHAGCEAALAAARMGFATTLVTLNLTEVARAPCNPAIGGPGKSQLVREVDALGGEMAKNADRTMINVRRLNTGKGPAMQVTRAQIDKDLYKLEMKRVLESTPNLRLVEGLVEELTWSGGKITGAIVREGVHFQARAVVVTTGTFLDGRVYIGERVYPAGRSGEPPAVGLSESLRRLGLELGRLNTGTTPRLNRHTIDTAVLERQDTAEEPLALSYASEPRVLPKDLPVYITRTTEETHRIIRENLHRNPGKNGTLGGVGPRYCPSIETKVLRFPDRLSHKVFLEPEGRFTEEVYMQGFNTSSPPEVQEAMVRSIPGLEEAKIERYGYDIDYDFVFPTQLKASLETKALRGLFLAGQINGTTGYEEAAAQGIIAGINAVRYLQGKEPIILGRAEAFIGVLIDDLVTKGTSEPYRMLPSRAEYRLLLREGNADLRLMALGHELRLVPDEQYERMRERQRLISAELDRLRRTWVKVNGRLPFVVEEGQTLYQLLKRPELDYDLLAPVDPTRPPLPAEVVGEVEIEAKYEGYIKRQLLQVERLRRLEDKMIPDELDYATVKNLSTEGREQLTRVRPRTLGQAARVPGVSQADLSILMVYLKSRRRSDRHGERALSGGGR